MSSASASEDQKEPQPPCPKCEKSDQVIPTTYGKPATSLIKEAEEGKVKLLGCCLPRDGNLLKHHCKSCDFSFH